MSCPSCSLHRATAAVSSNAVAPRVRPDSARPGAMWGEKGRGRARQPSLRHLRPKGKSKGDDVHQGSHLAKFLLEQWSWGLMSPQLVQAISAKARADYDAWHGADKPGVAKDLDDLASLGSDGAYPNNCHRDILMCLPENKTPEALHFTLMCKTPRSGVYAPKHMHMLLPHEMFAHLYHEYPEHWKQYVCPSKDCLESFWSDIARHPALAGNPIKDEADWARNTVPLSLHGDGVPVKGVGKSWSESMNVYSWCSLVAGAGPTIDFNFLIFSIFQHLIASGAACKTMDTFWRIMCWSFTWLFKGQWPTHGWDGTPIRSHRAGTWLADGHRGLLFMLKGDIEYFQKETRSVERSISTCHW